MMTQLQLLYEAIAAFEQHGQLARTVDHDIQTDVDLIAELDAVGVDMDEVGLTLEQQGVTAFHESFTHLLQSLRDKAPQLVRP